MDHDRFDAMTKALAAGTSRRVVFRRVGAALGGVLGLGVSRSLAAPKGGGGGKPQGRCPTGFTNCRGTCVDLTGDSDHCGACATVCPESRPICAEGVCVADVEETCTGLPLNAPCETAAQCCQDGADVACRPIEDLGQPECCRPLGAACTTSGAFNECCVAFLEGGGARLVYCAPDGTCGGPGATCSSSATCASGLVCLGDDPFGQCSG